jgi:membrane protease YdiL (CAAX protease family)
MRYAPHEMLVRDARGRPALWRLVLGLVLAMAVYMGLVYAVFGLVAALRGAAIASAIFQSIFVTTLSGSDAVFLLLSFAALLVGTLVAANLLHGRRLPSLTGPPARAAAHFTRTLRALTLLYAVLWVALPTDIELVPNLGLERWLSLLPLAVLALLIQTGAEELLFRGYIQQQLAARFRSPIIWIGVPSALFALGHYAPDEAGQNAVAAALWAGVFALAAADLTARTGTLGAAIALHFANNAASVLLVSLPGPVSGLSLYTYPFAADDPAVQPLMLVDLGVIGVSWLAARVALRV